MAKAFGNFTRQHEARANRLFFRATTPASADNKPTPAVDPMPPQPVAATLPERPTETKCPSPDA